MTTRPKPGFVLIKFDGLLHKLNHRGVDGRAGVALAALLAQYGRWVGERRSYAVEEALATLNQLLDAEPQEDERGGYRRPLSMSSAREALGRLATLHGLLDPETESLVREVRAELESYIDGHNPTLAHDEIADRVHMLLALVGALLHHLEVQSGTIWPFAGDHDIRATITVDAGRGFTARGMLLTFGTEIMRSARKSRRRMTGASGASQMSLLMEELGYWGRTAPPETIANEYEKRRSSIRRASRRLPGRQLSLPKRIPWTEVADAYFEAGSALKAENPRVFVPEAGILPV